MVPAAQTCARLWKVPASVTLAQAILESAWGTSQLARRANNLFGIKATPDLLAANSYAEFPTREVVTGRSVVELAKFARYGTVLDCFAAHAHLLSKTPRYAGMVYQRRYPRAYAVELQTRGYSTNESYGQSLIALMDQHDLYQYDTPAGDPAPAQEAA